MSKQVTLGKRIFSIWYWNRRPECRTLLNGSEIRDTSRGIKKFFSSGLVCLSSPQNCQKEHVLEKWEEGREGGKEERNIPWRKETRSVSFSGCILIIFSYTESKGEWKQELTARISLLSFIFRHEQRTVHTQRRKSQLLLKSSGILSQKGKWDKSLTLDSVTVKFPLQSIHRLSNIELWSQIQENISASTKGHLSPFDFNGA